MNKTIVRTYLLGLHEQIIASLESLDGNAFSADLWERPHGSAGITCVLENGNIFERAGVSFSHVKGESLPASASESRRRLVGSTYEAMGVSLVLHPRNPYCPTVHLNVRYFEARHAPKFDAEAPSRFAASPLRNKGAGSDSSAASARQTTWWFGGGMDLTPFYPFEEDVRHFHQTCHDAVAPLDESLPLRFKRACDEYFFLKHRDEARGVGGLFFDDFNEQSFEHSFNVMKSVGDAFLSAYLPIIRLRCEHPYGERERDFQSYRRGRYAEFNLALDRGTHFGLQSGGRTESILISMPPTASWRYDWAPEPGSPEARLSEEFLKPRDWV